MRILLALCLCLFVPCAAMADGKSIIVLDASGSMWGQIDGRPKLEIAREALGEVLATMPADTALGLMAYGHRTKGDCADIELVVPPAAGTAQAITDAANGLKFLGKTPLTDAVRMAATELRSTEEKATVILITDGIETCEADPCALGAELEASGVDFTAHVVGFGLTAEEGATVACLAENTGGQYIEAKDAGALVDALQTTVVAEPVVEPEPEPVPEPEPSPTVVVVNIAPTAVLAPGVPIPEDNTDVVWEVYTIQADGARGERITTEYNDYKGFIEPGTYILVAKLDTVEVSQEVTLVADRLTSPEVVMNAARVLLHPKAAADAEIDSGAALQFTNATGLDTTTYGDTRIYLAAGDTIVKGKMGSATVSETLSLTAGQMVDRDLIIGAGVVGIEAYYVEGALIDGSAHFVEVLSAKKALDGSRESITSGYGAGISFDLPAGDYIARATLQSASAEVPFSIKVGERVDVPVILNAGVLFISAPGANSIEVLEGKADLGGNRDTLTFEYNTEVTLTAPPGDYLVRANRGDVQATATAVVKPGERTEVAVP
jgi:Ca-activated chloride channel homolog